MPSFTAKQRKQVEDLIIKSMDVLDKSGTNGDYYRQMFANMSDTQFQNLFKKNLPLRLQYRPSVVEPTMGDIEDALKYINVPLTEKVNLNYLYKNSEGKSVQSKECTVIYMPLKPEQQFITKKNKWSPDISNRDMKTGRLLGADKGSATSDREFESFAAFGLDKTMKEFYGPKADSMNAKNVMYNVIGTTGILHEDDIPDSIDDSLARNMFNVYLIGAHLNSNLINQGDYTMYTLKERKRKGVSREED